LKNTLTHEVGHLMGLDHTCWDGQPPRPIDDDGNDVPGCIPENALPAAITDATMYATQTRGETKTASPSPADIAANCTIYPLADDPGSCKRASLTTEKGCCAIAGAPAATGAGRLGHGALGLLALLGLAFIRSAGRTRAARAASSSARP
jgi:hypothetical protein